MITDDTGKEVMAEGVLKRLLQSGLLCSDAVIFPKDDGKYSCIGDPTEAALVTMAGKVGFVKEIANKEYPRVTELRSIRTGK
jgi:Ca2+-transporting ATPase